MKTFIGELILRLKDEAGANAQKAAERIDKSVQSIERSGKRLSSAPWGVGFQRQLDKIGAGASDIEKLRQSWDRLYADMSGKNLSKALQKSEVAGWKTSVLAHFSQQQAQLREEMTKTEKHAKGWKARMDNLFKVGLVAMGGYTGAYITAVGLQAGLSSSADRQREYFRQQMGNLPMGDRNKIISTSSALGAQYPSVNITDIMELGRNARSMMGDVDKGMQVLPDLVRAYVALQSSQDVNVGPETLRNMLRGIDNLGQNGGANGVQQTRDIIAGMVRAVQIEGADFDPGKLFEFARRAKIAGPGFSTEFLATTVPAIVQDMTANGAGTSFGTQFQAFAMGSNATANKEQIANQVKFGIRDQNGLVNYRLFAQDPFRWAQEVLRPALTKGGVDVNNEEEVAKAVAGFTKAQMASYGMTRMITQADQIERNRRNYANAMGPDAADQARQNDPYLALESFKQAMSNLAAAVGEDTMPVIVKGLNGLADAINKLQGLWSEGDPLAKAGLTVGAGIGAFGTWKILSGIYGLATAGTSLQAAAVSLEAAAVSLGGPGAVKDAAKVGGKGGWLAALGPWGATIAAGLIQSGSQGPQDPAKQKAQIDRDMGEWVKAHPFIPDRRKSQNPYDLLAQQRAASEIQNPLQNAVDNASRAGSQMQEALSVKAKPEVETSSIDSAIAKAKELLGLIGQIGTATNNLPTPANVERQMNRSFSDHGIAP